MVCEIEPAHNHLIALILVVGNSYFCDFGNRYLLTGVVGIAILHTME
jgi:hypothetical protein